jgi:predicted dienelactone hydrolase
VTVGARDLLVDDIAVRLLYPADAAQAPVAFGPFQLEVAMDAPVVGAGLPLVLVSHGTGSTPWLHRELAAHLARAGFVVALLQHPGNHRGDDHLGGKAINLVNRPRHVRQVADALFASLGAALAPGYAVIGHSLGGYTALAVAGGEPTAFAWETPDGAAGPLVVEHDPRVRAVALLAPATPWFLAEGALAGVHVPVFMRSGAKDPHADAMHARIVAHGLPAGTRLDHAVVPGAGHFAFVSPYPAHLKSPSIPPSQDPDGFDRVAYLPTLFAELTAFLRA